MTHETLPVMRRRDVLALASAGVLASAGLGSRALARPPAPGPVHPRETWETASLSVGYWQGDEAPFRPHLMGAEALPEGDPRFAYEGARLWIHGMFFPAEAETCAPLAWLSIDVNFAPFHAVPFHAWRFENAPVPRRSSPSCCVVPIAAGYGLTLTVTFAEAVYDSSQPLARHGSAADLLGHTGATERSGRDELAPQQVRLRFTLGREPQRPKLRRGTYVLAWRAADTRTLPTWSAYQWRPVAVDHEGAGRGLGRWDGRRRALTPANFVYVVLSLDYGDQRLSA